MNKNSIIASVIALIAGLLIAGGSAAYAVNNNNQGFMKVLGIDSSKVDQKPTATSDDSMDSMVTSLKSKTGDDFDKTFISEMITHHQGAIDMANLAKTNAKHDEIKSMADDIVNAQTKEINQMKIWQNDWGYATSSPGGHDMMNMH